MKGRVVLNRGLIEEAGALIADLEQEVAVTTYRDRHLALEKEVKAKAKAQSKTPAKTTSKKK